MNNNSQNKVTLQGYIVVPETDFDAVVAALPEHITLTRQEPGCERFEVTPDESRQGHFVVDEIFTNAAAFRAHQERVNDSPWWHITQNVERHYTITGLPPDTRLQPHAVADYFIGLAVVLFTIAVFYGLIVVSLDPVDYLTGIGEVILAPLYPGLYLYWPPLAALVLLGIDWLGFTRVTRRRWRLPLFIVSNTLWIGLGVEVIVLWYI